MTAFTVLYHEKIWGMVLSSGLTFFLNSQRFFWKVALSSWTMKPLSSRTETGNQLLRLLKAASVLSKRWDRFERSSLPFVYTKKATSARSSWSLVTTLPSSVAVVTWEVFDVEAFGVGYVRC